MEEQEQTEEMESRNSLRPTGESGVFSLTPSLSRWERILRTQIRALNPRTGSRPLSLPSLAAGERVAAGRERGRFMGSFDLQQRTRIGAMNLLVVQASACPWC